MARRGLTVEDAARLLGTTARALRRREALGLLPRVRLQAGAHRRYDDAALRAARLSALLEQRHAVTPGTLAFAVHALTDPRIAADVRALALASGRSVPSATDVLGFEQEKALRLLRRS